MAFGGITSNLLRTFLTVLGIAIGVAAVVSLMGIGEGARKSIVSQFESLGQNVIVIKSNVDKVRFDTADVVRVTGVEYATPVVNKKKAKVRWRREETNFDLVGVNGDYSKIKDHNIISGNFFTSLHVSQRAPVAVLGYNIAQSLLKGRSPVGQILKIEGINYRVVGVLAEKGEGKGDGIDNKIIIPYTSALKIIQKKNVDEIWAKSNNAEDAELAMVQLGRIYKREVGIGSNILPSNGENKGEGGSEGEAPSDSGEAPPSDIGASTAEVSTSEEVAVDEGSENPEEPGKESDDKEKNAFKKGEEPLTITSLNNLVKEADQANRIMTVLLGGIAAVSLLVGGIGIMNIMLVAVTERTSEIGVRRALGAKQEDLLIQFMLEAIYVSIIGCFVGILLGAWAVSVVSRYGLNAVISFQSIKIALGVALSSGLLFGVYPAINASSLPPVEALKRS